MRACGQVWTAQETHDFSPLASETEGEAGDEEDENEDEDACDLEASWSSLASDSLRRLEL